MGFEVRTLETLTLTAPVDERTSSRLHRSFEPTRIRTTLSVESLTIQNYNTDLHLGQFPSALQGMAMASGLPTPDVPIYKRTFPFPTKISHYTIENPSGISAWSTNNSCPWAREGIYTINDGKAVALQHKYFTTDRNGSRVDFYHDFYFPFVRRWDRIVKRRKGAAMMVEAIPNEFCPEWKEEDRPDGFVYAPHW